MVFFLRTDSIYAAARRYGALVHTCGISATQKKFLKEIIWSVLQKILLFMNFMAH